MRLRRLFIALLAAAVILVVPVSMPGVYAASGPGVTSHTQDQIRAYINNSGVSLNDPTEYKTQPVKPTVRGELTDNCKNKALKMLNNIRYIAGLDAVSLSSSQGSLAQAAAFADYVLDTLTHTPDTTYDSNGNAVSVPKPDGMSDTDWADGNTGGRKTNIAWNYGTMNRSVYGWTHDEDSGNISRVGHRRWVLNPKMGTTGFGSAGAYSAMYSMDSSNTSASQTSVAWPAQNMPVDFFESDLPWTFSTGRTITKSNVRVTLTRLNDNKVWNFSGAQSYSTSAAKYFNVDNDGYGQVGCIIFRPDGIDAYRDGDQFRVEITGAGSDISYTVNFFSLVPMTGIEFSSDPVTVPFGETKTVSLRAIPSDTSDSIDKTKVTYSISDTSIATVDSNGVITAKNLGQTTITARYKGFTTTADLFVSKSIRDCTVELVSPYVVFTGFPVLPKFNVTDGDYTLVEGVDYDVVPYYEGDELTYPSEGWGYAAVRGKGKYNSTSKGYGFRVTAKSITEDMVAMSETSIPYDGKTHSPDVVLTYNGMELVEGTDYTITKAAGVNAGSYKHVIKGIGNYSGTYNASFSINKLNLNSSMFSVDDSDLVYDGSVQKPVVTGKHGNLDLVQGTDYTVVFDEAVNAGTYNLTITGKGNCTGTVPLTFKIQKANYPPTMPEDTYAVPYLTKKLDNNILEDAKGWEFDPDDIGSDLIIGENEFVAKYTGKGAGNYIHETKNVTVARKECLHPEASVVIIKKVDPDCENDGYTGDKYCNDCEQVIEEGKIDPATGHLWSRWKTTTPPTCLMEGEEARTCSKCSKEETRPVDKLEHDLSTVKEKEPGCETEGNKEYQTCSMCNGYFDNDGKPITEEDVILPVYGHTWSDWTTTTYPTCTKKGEDTRTCSVCSKAETRPVDKLPHQLKLVEAVAPACESAGNIEYYVCDVCGGLFDNETDQNELSEADVAVPAAGHKWGAWETTKEPSEAAAGEKTRKCSVCEAVETESIPYQAPEAEQSDVDAVPAEDEVAAGASAKAVEKFLTNRKSDADPAGSEFGKLKLKVKKNKKTSQTLKWSKVKKAARYDVYTNKCGKTNKLKKVASVKGKTTYTAKKLKKGKYYKYLVVAVGSDGKVISSSKIIHMATAGGKVGNHKSVKTKAKNNKVTVKKGKKFKLAGKAIPASSKLKVKKHVEVRYESSNPKVATVSKTGVIKGLMKGKTCYVYVYAQDGVYKKIKVKVS